ncbi:hypothetical protein Tco_0012427 [Tanacetum coccineum]
MTLPEIPNFASLFQFDQRVSALESEMSEFRQISQFAESISSISGIVDTYLASKMKEAVDVAVQLQTNKLREEAQAENQEFLNKIDSTIKAIIKEQVQAQVSKIMPKIEKYVTGILGRGRDDQDKDKDPYAGSNRGSNRRRSGKEAESLKEPTNKESKSISSSKSASKSQQKSSSKSAHAEENDQKTADLEDQPHQEFNTGNEDVSPVREALNKDVWHRNPSRPLTPDREWHKTKTVDNRPPYLRSHKWLKLQALNLRLMSTRKSLVKLECHLEEVFKATNDRLDWHNPEGKPYPHDLNKPLQLILNEQGRQDDQLYKFREGDFKRLHRQDIEDMLLLPVQDKLTNLNLEEQFALNVALQMFTRHEMNRNRLMHIDELYKFSDGTLNHVRTALNDIALGIEMEYLPKRKWSKQDRQRARVMINAIDKKLRDRRLMRSLEKFVGGRPYEGDLRLLKRTI